MENEVKKVAEQLQKVIKKLSADLETLQVLVGQLTGDVTQTSSPHMMKAMNLTSIESPEGRIVEGVFDGTTMIGADGKKYSVPANYASKSKLVEGDILKLNIKPDGTFIYKQIGPVERSVIEGILTRVPETNEWQAVTPDGHIYKLITASVTYFRGEEGDKITVSIPKDGQSMHGAVENIMSELGPRSPMGSVDKITPPDFAEDGDNS